MSRSFLSQPPAASADRRPFGETLRGERAALLARLPELLLACVAAALIVASYQEAWWSLRLYAPQYPEGLAIDILLTGVRGDVREIDTLNHYIGMAPLGDAAVLERRLAAYAVGLLAVAILGLVASGKRWTYLGAFAVSFLFPVGFVIDSFYWLHRFGHELNPRAPLDLPAFTPELFGNGRIGQFMTFARPENGFYLALASAAIVGGISLLAYRRATVRERRA